MKIKTGDRFRFKRDIWQYGIKTGDELEITKVVDGDVFVEMSLTIDNSNRISCELITIMLRQETIERLEKS